MTIRRQGNTKLQTINFRDFKEEEEEEENIVKKKKCFSSEVTEY